MSAERSTLARESLGDERTTTPAPPTYSQDVSASRDSRHPVVEKDRETEREMPTRPPRSRQQKKVRLEPCSELHEVHAPRNGRDPRSE